ncbi:cytochrome P450 [Hypoxylon argillaceum]|nr:cytochrome P450 [Hypoxylon argillaceum]
MTSLIETTVIAAPSILGAAVTLGLVITFLNLIYRLFSNASLPSTLPWAGVGEHNSSLGRAKANFTSFFDLKKLLDEGYVKYSKNNKTYVLPYFINGPQVVLPPSQIPWLLEQPDDVLSQEHINRQFLKSDYTFFQANRVKDPVHPEVIQHQLTKKINSFADDIADEVRATLDDAWGTDTEEWREVRVYDTMLLMITRMSIRVFMGLPLCRNETFLFICSSYIRKVALAAAAISLFPRFLEPIVAPVFTLFDYVLYRRSRGFVMPIIRERLAELRDPDAAAAAKLSPEGLTPPPPNDFMQWAIGHALARPVVDPVELDARVLAARFAVLAFAAIQSSVITLTNTLFDLAASPCCAASLASMHAEVARETAAAAAAATTASKGGQQQGLLASAWSRPVLARMARVDSALRESLRLNGFVERGVVKMVVRPAGVTLPDGSHVPRGTKVGVSAYSIHRDEGNYADAARYDAFRFVRGPEGGEKRPQGLVNTSETFLGFSHGAHSCPGRFFATNQLKIALGHIALLYEIEPIPKRPANRWFFGHIAPPLTETLRVRRRKTVS